MRRLATILAVVLGLSAAAQAGEPTRRRPGLQASQLAAWLPGAGDVFGAWEIVEEPPEDLRGDREFRRRGLRGSQARHYTRSQGPVSEVCSIELWAFDDPTRAAVGAASLARPGWQIEPLGDLVILVHGVRHERGGGMRSGLPAGCDELADQTRARIRRRR